MNCFIPLPSEPGIIPQAGYQAQNLTQRQIKKAFNVRAELKCRVGGRLSSSRLSVEMAESWHVPTESDYKVLALGRYRVRGRLRRGDVGMCLGFRRWYDGRLSLVRVLSKFGVTTCNNAAQNFFQHK